MKNIPLLCVVLALTACGNSVEKRAAAKLSIAQMAYEQGHYLEAKQQIDSIKILYPKAFDTRKAAQTLLLDVELKIQQQLVAHLDSALTEGTQQLNKLKPKFVLEKDTAYQQIGRYLWPTQTVEKNLHRCYLRFQVSEQGELSMTSIYCGSRNINHVRVKVSTADGSWAETPDSKDSYETTDLGEKIEKADYKLGEEGGVIAFIAEHKDQHIRVVFEGDRSYTTQMLPTDCQAAAEVLSLQQIIAPMQQIQKEKEAAQLKIGFIEKKKERERLELEK
jgi:hypothetical protein